MAKKVKVKLKFQLEAGKAVPGQKLGPVLGQHGVPIGEFVNKYNDMTRSMMGDIIPCVLTVFEDRTFAIELRTPPVASLLIKAAGIPKGSGTPNTVKSGKVKRSAIKEIAERKMSELNAIKIESAIKIVEGTAKSLGLEIID